MTEEQRVMQIAEYAEDVVNAAEVAHEFEDGYVVHIPKDDWLLLIDAINTDSNGEDE
jgi:hypothetical protein